MSERKAIVLFGHGSRDPLWRLPIEAVAARLRSQRRDVGAAPTWSWTPDLPGAAANWWPPARGQVTVVPMFLGTGRHAREDLPVLANALRGRHPAGPTSTCSSPWARTRASWTCWHRLRSNKDAGHNEFLS